MPPILRPYRPGDAADLAQVFHDAVHQGANTLYSKQECNAWSPHPLPPQDWQTRLADTVTFVAESNGQPIGFMTLSLQDAHIDFAYIRPDFMRQSVASRLCVLIEGRARCAGLVRLETHASRMAEPFFKSQGWAVVERRIVQSNGIAIANAQMMKDLPAYDPLNLV
jgi:putative acetyltransferase